MQTLQLAELKCPPSRVSDLLTHGLESKQYLDIDDSPETLGVFCSISLKLQGERYPGIFYGFLFLRVSKMQG
jgi:hypothetical protein